VHFDWDPDKAALNLRVHGISLGEATETWEDRGGREEFDAEHSHREPRWRRIGMSGSKRLLLVTFTRRGDIIRLISARRATKRERHDYEDG
jgi:uncharacterized DUF497 family protein